MKEKEKLPTNSSSTPSTPPPGEISREDAVMIKKIKAIASRGNDAEIRRKKDGRLYVYEINKRII